MADMMPKVRELRDRYPELDIQVDGGITVDTVKDASSNGANCIVSGTGIFKAEDPEYAIRVMRESVEASGFRIRKGTKENQAERRGSKPAYQATRPGLDRGKSNTSVFSQTSGTTGKGEGRSIDFDSDSQEADASSDEEEEEEKVELAYFDNQPLRKWDHYEASLAPSASAPEYSTCLKNTLLDPKYYRNQSYCLLAVTCS